MELIENLLQLLVTFVGALLSGISYRKSRRQAYFLLLCFYGCFALGALYWTLYLLLFDTTPRVFYVSEFGWVASVIFLRILQATLTSQDERSFFCRRAWLAPAFGVPLLAAGADAAVLDVLNDLKDVTPAATNARISATHSPENGAEKTEKSERELHYDVKYPYDLSHEEVSDTDKALAAAMEAIADGPSITVLKTILANQDVLELVGAHSHIGSNIHDADAFIHAAKRMMLLRKTLWATDAYILPEIDLGGGYSVAYTDGEDSMDIDVELTRLADAVNSTNRALGMPAPAISFEPGRYIVAPAGVTLYRVGTIKHVHLSDAKDSDGNPIAERVYVSVDGGMSDNIRPALYGADYTARLANRSGSAETMLARVCGMHCESGDIVVHEVQLPADLKRGDILAVPVPGAYGRSMASNYNQALIPAVVAVSESGAHVMLRRQPEADLLTLDVSE